MAKKINKNDAEEVPQCECRSRNEDFFGRKRERTYTEYVVLGTKMERIWRDHANVDEKFDSSDASATPETYDFSSSAPRPTSLGSLPVPCIGVGSTAQFRTFCLVGAS